MRRFFIRPDALKKDPPAVTGPEAVHIAAVLRMNAGDRAVLFDGTGLEYDAVLLSVKKSRVSFRILEKRRVPETPLPIITIAQALLKDRKMDLLVRQLSELGVFEFIPFSSRRAVVRTDPGRLNHRRQRWGKIVIQAMKQCERPTAMHLGALVSFESVLALGRRFDHRILFWEKADAFPPPSAPRREAEPGSVLAILGPEGGFSDAEAAQAENAGFTTASLGPWILRSDTAAVAAAAVLQYRFGKRFPRGGIPSHGRDG